MSHQKITPADARLIRALGEERDRLLARSRELADQAAEVRAQAMQLSNAKIAEKFEVAKTTVDDIIRGRSRRALG